MKKIILIIMIFVNSCYGIEIQCFSQAANIHTTIIKEDTTPRLFILFDDGENFLNYFQLDQSLVDVSEASLSYNDDDLSIKLFKDNSGIIQSKNELILLGKKYRELQVDKCNFLNIDL